MIYLDNGATTFPKPGCVYDAMDDFARNHAVNAGRGAYKEARAAGTMIKEVRDMLLSLIDAKGMAQVALTPSVTIALNEAILGYSWSENDVVYVSPYEHNSVLRPIEMMRRKFGFKVNKMPLADNLAIDLAELEKMFAAEPPTYVAITAVSNVTGYILPAKDIFKLAKKYKAFTLLDGSQAVGTLRLKFPELRADVITFAGHKTLYGPFGIAGFYIRNGVELDAVLSGGTGSISTEDIMPEGIPDRFECGSKDTVAIAGLHAALKWLQDEHIKEAEDEVMDYLLEQLKTVPGIVIYGAPDRASQAAVVSINVEGYKCNEAAALLDAKHDIAIRAGHHCAAYIHDLLKDEKFGGTARVSLSYFSTKKDVDVLIEGLKSLDKDALADIPDDILRGTC